MGWTIEHIPGRSENRPYSLVADALDLAGCHGQARALTPLTTRTGGQDADPFTLTPSESARVRDALTEAVARLGRRDRRAYEPVLRDLAAAADRAARSGRPWQWS